MFVASRQFIPDNCAPKLQHQHRDCICKSHLHAYYVTLRLYCTFFYIFRCFSRLNCNAAFCLFRFEVILKLFPLLVTVISLFIALLMGFEILILFLSTGIRAAPSQKGYHRCFFSLGTKPSWVSASNESWINIILKLMAVIARTWLPLLLFFIIISLN